MRLQSPATVLEMKRAGERWRAASDPSTVNLSRRSETMPDAWDYTDSAGFGKVPHKSGENPAKYVEVPVPYLRSRVSYVPETGKLYWNEPTPDMEGNLLLWHRRRAGYEAFATLSNKGYFVGSFDNRMFSAHRVAWAIHYGEWPTEEIDHINRVRTDNRIANLRDVDRSVNSLNRAPSQTSRRGLPFGVCWKNSKYYTYLSMNGERVYLGCFTELSEATEIVEKAKECRDIGAPLPLVRKRIRS
jgi:hypothetical protein